VIVRDGIATAQKAKQYELHNNHLILAVSSNIAVALKANPTFADRTHILFNSVSIPPAGPDDVYMLDRLLESHSSVRRWLLIVGKLSSRKNQADGVRVVRRLVDAGHRDVGLILAGDIDPDYQQEIKAVIDESKLNERVAMIGNFNGLQTLIDRAHMVLLTSFREGLPRSLVEAISAGKPAFTYPCEGVADIYGEQFARFVSPEFTPNSLHHKLQEALENPAEINLALCEIRERVKAQFSPAAHLARLKSLLTGSAQAPSH
jgi:glycosyltransferase involved in cell wall biosynthesis